MTAPRASLAQWQLEQAARTSRLTAWCAACEEYMVTVAGQLCPVCDDEKRKAS